MSSNSRQYSHVVASKLVFLCSVYIVVLLVFLQMEPFSYRAQKQLSVSVSTTRISLAQIADKERRVLRG